MHICDSFSRNQSLVNFVHFEMYLFLKAANSADYFCIKIKTLDVFVMKLWPFAIVMHHGSHFKKTQDCVSFCILFIANGVQS